MTIARRFAHGSTWMVIGTSADNIVQFIVFAILARILPVRDLGIVTFTMLFIDLSRVLVTGGLPQAIVQRQEWDSHVASVLFTYNAVMAIAVAALFAGIGAPLMERFYGPGTGLVAASLGLVFFIDAVKGVHAAKLRREMKYRSLAVRGSLASIIAGPIAIGMALAGAGVWALVFHRLTIQVVATVLTWRAAQWRPSIQLDRQVLREAMPFAVEITVKSGLEVLNSRLPDILVGFIIGPIGVAIYRVGTRARDTLRRIIILPFQDASFAAMSRLGDNRAIVSAYVRLSRAVAIATFPIFLGSTAVAVEMTVLLFGPRYAASGSIFGILAIAGIPNTLASFASSAFMASGQPRIGTTINISLMAFNIFLIIPSAYFWGNVGAAIGSATATIAIGPIVALQLKRKLGMRIRELARAIFPPALIASLMTVAIWLIKTYLLPPMPNGEKIVILITLGAVMYVGMFATWGRSHLNELLLDLQPILPAAIRHRMKLHLRPPFSATRISGSRRRPRAEAL